ncbi:serine hydrolase [Merdimmobilis hominis]|uniref:6-aminohexanoate-dimer hydrolase n=2 Tax=Oscillospiraceae TaxID=216572 RepID=A0A6N2TVY0_9FIRM
MTMKKWLCVLCALLFLLAGCSQPQGGEGDSHGGDSSSQEESSPEENGRWEFDLPENHDMDPQRLQLLHEALADSSVYAMVTAKDGVIVDEFYQTGYDETSVFPLHSCSKSFTGALVGIAIQEGLLGGVDDLLSEYLPQVRELGDQGKGQITLRHLLTHTSGLEWYEWGEGASNWIEFQSSPNWVEYILERNLVAQPGKQFNYSTGNTHLLAAVLQQATGMNMLDYAKQVLFDPLGIESVQWGTDPQGIVDGGNGISMTARDAARFGQLYLEGGLWNGEQIIPQWWLEESTTAQNNGAGDGTGSYGYQWWIRSFGEGRYDTYYAFGAWGQYIFVVPELDLVTVIASHYPENSYAPRPYFTDYILAACRG